MREGDRRDASEEAGRSFVEHDFSPAYLELLRTGVLQDRAAAAVERLRCCTACPRSCHVDRLSDVPGVCGTGRHAILSAAFAHFGEERCLVGRRGSGTIFFSRCNLHCVFCQNWEISQSGEGRAADGGQIARLMLDLQESGCHNINLVTPEHVVPQVIEAVALAAEDGLRLPIVYNTSAYDSIESLRALDGLIDIYMPDFKYWSPETARLLSEAGDYPERARQAIREMHRQVGDLRFDARGIAQRGLLVRHLVMPGLVEESQSIFRWLAEEISADTFVNIMDQYRPAYRVLGEHGRFRSIDRPPTAAELNCVREGARAAGLWRFDD